MASKGMAWLKDCEMWLEAKPLCSQDSTRWHDLRSQGITASEIATVVGLNPFEQPLELFKRKRAAVVPYQIMDTLRARTERLRCSPGPPHRAPYRCRSRRE